MNAILSVISSSKALYGQIDETHRAFNGTSKTPGKGLCATVSVIEQIHGASTVSECSGSMKAASSIAEWCAVLENKMRESHEMGYRRKCLVPSRRFELVSQLRV